MQSNFISYSYVKFLAEEKEVVREPVKSKDWISMVYHIFFSTGVEINKEKET
jgi:hypothetical protein